MDTVNSTQIKAKDNMITIVITCLSLFVFIFSFFLPVCSATVLGTTVSASIVDGPKEELVYPFAILLIVAILSITAIVKPYRFSRIHLFVSGFLCVVLAVILFLMVKYSSTSSESLEYAESLGEISNHMLKPDVGFYLILISGFAFIVSALLLKISNNSIISVDPLKNNLSNETQSGYNRSDFYSEPGNIVVDERASYYNTLLKQGIITESEYKVLLASWASNNTSSDIPTNAPAKKTNLHNKKKLSKKEVVLVVTVISIVIIVLLSLALILWGIPLITYYSAKNMLKNDRFDEAYSAFEKIEDFKDSKECLKECKYQKGFWQLVNKQYSEAIESFKSISGYSNADTMVLESMYRYVIDHKTHTSIQTYSYLKELKEKKYKDSESLYINLYDWKVTLVYCNDVSGDFETNSQTIRKGQSYFHCWFKLEGGTPIGSINLCPGWELPNGSQYHANWNWENKCNGSEFGFENKTGAIFSEGINKIFVIDSDTNTILYSVSITVVK